MKHEALILKEKLDTLHRNYKLDKNKDVKKYIDKIFKLLK